MIPSARWRKMKTGLRWIAGNPGNDSESSSLVQLWIRNESRRKRIRLRRVWLLRSYKGLCFYERCGSSCQIHHSYGGVWG